MKIRTLPLLLPSVLAAAVFAPSAAAIITLNGQEVSGFTITNVGGNVEITTTVGNPDPTPDPSPDPSPDPTPDPAPDPAPDPGNCGAESQEMVFETLNWAQPPGQTVIDVPRDDAVSSGFTTTGSTTYVGNIVLGPTTGTGYVRRNIWISTCPGGPPVEQAYDGCRSVGTEASIRWSQEVSPRSRLACKLEPNTTYYLNYQNEGCNASGCDAFRNTYHN